MYVKLHSFCAEAATSASTVATSATSTTASSSAKVSISKVSCDSLASCSPSACRTSSDSSCSINLPAVNHQAKLAEMTCKQCQQSKDTKCTKLAQILKKNQGVAAAYCNADFLVVWANGKPKWDAAAEGDYLNGIPVPPGGDGSCRVRTAGKQLWVWKIPLATTVQAGANTVALPLDGVPGMPAAGAIGMAVDGVPMFPNYNNRGKPAWVSCEVDRCNAHSGKGDDYHYHGDPYGTKCLYHDADYTGLTHPPVIGFALDGYAIHGRYTQASQDGTDIALDSCGGHSHSVDGVEDVYHYHPEVEEGLTTHSLDGVNSGGPFSFTAYRLAPTTCWRGDVGLIANFWRADGRQANFDRTKGSFSSSSANDYEELRPCCGSTYFAAASGMAINGVGACEGDCDLGTINA